MQGEARPVAAARAQFGSMIQSFDFACRMFVSGGGLLLVDSTRDFLEFALRNARDPKQINCPCMLCGNDDSYLVRVVKDYLFVNGIDPSYVIWSEHGETTLVSDSDSDHEMDTDSDESVVMTPSKKSTPRKSKKAASNKTAGSASATISIASKRKKSKNHEEESEKGLKLLKLNCVAMKRISRSRSLKQKRVVQFNRTGTPYGKVATEMNSYIGVLARRKGAFVIGNESKRVVMQSAAARWREFKSRLTKVYIVPYLDQAEMLKYPPQDYKIINADNWTQFVTERTKPTFLACRMMNKYPHRLSRKSYIRLVAKLKAKAEPVPVSCPEKHQNARYDCLC
ncbi:hypothetical protein ACLB2K_038215 [Fragaria x ananassa]